MEWKSKLLHKTISCSVSDPRIGGNGVGEIKGEFSEILFLFSIGRFDQKKKKYMKDRGEGEGTGRTK